MHSIFWLNLLKASVLSAGLMSIIGNSNQALAETSKSHSHQSSSDSNTTVLYELSQNQLDDILPPETEQEIPDQFELEDLVPENLEDLEETEEEVEPQVIEDTRQFLLDALSESAERYPFIINPSDGLTFSEGLFNPNEQQNYSEFDIRFAEDNPLFEQFSFANFPDQNQFYWLLDDNRVVIETRGTQGGMIYQGRTEDIEIIQDFTLTQSFFGVQAMWAFPGDFEQFSGDQEDLDEFTIISLIAGAGNNEDAEEIDITTSIDGLDLENSDNRDVTLGIGTGSTDRIEGGGSLFENVDPANAPRMLQAFPTVNLSPLLDGGSVPLVEGATIPESAVEEAGITFASPITDEEAGFDFEFSSDPAIKIGQRDTFDNLDLLSVLINPFLSERERDVRYLNSLFWASLGQREIEVSTQENRENFDWHRFYASYAHNRTLLKYDSEEIAATYTNVFVNPGVSLSLSLDKGEIDTAQSINSTAGMLLGTPLTLLTGINDLQSSLNEGKQKFEAGEQVTPLETRATSDQRRQMNERLNRTLRSGNLSSELVQVSGTVTFPSKVTPNNSSLLQLRTGLYRRRVQLQEQSISTTRGQPFFSETRISSEDFNLRFLGVPAAGSNSRDVPLSAEVGVISPDGEQFVQEFSSDVPLSTEAFTIAFDRLEISRIDRRTVEFEQFRGVLDLPSVELLWSGSYQDFNYGITAGTWFNFDRDSVPGMSGIDEPSAGVYLGSVLNWTLTRVQRNEQGNPIGVDAHIPSFRVSWNSAINERNPFSATLSYTYINQRQSRSFTLSPLIVYTPNGGREEDTTTTDFIGLLRGQLSFNTGLTFDTSLELRDELFYNLDATQQIDPDLSIGLFISNFTRTLTGLSGRNEEFNIGPIIQFNSDNVTLNARFGLGGNNPDLRFEGNFSF